MPLKPQTLSLSVSPGFWGSNTRIALFSQPRLHSRHVSCTLVKLSAATHNRSEFVYWSQHQGTPSAKMARSASRRRGRCRIRLGQGHWRPACYRTGPDAVCSWKLRGCRPALACSTRTVTVPTRPVWGPGGLDGHLAWRRHPGHVNLLALCKSFLAAQPLLATISSRSQPRPLWTGDSAGLVARAYC
jgi:hypothetical protein